MSTIDRDPYDMQQELMNEYVRMASGSPGKFKEGLIRDLHLAAQQNPMMAGHIYEIFPRRKNQRTPDGQIREFMMERGTLTIRPDGKTIFTAVDGSENRLRVTDSQQIILAVLLQNPQAVLSAKEILIASKLDIIEGSLLGLISSIRRNFGRHITIYTHRGIGYSLTPPKDIPMNGTDMEVAPPQPLVTDRGQERQAAADEARLLYRVHASSQTEVKRSITPEERRKGIIMQIRRYIQAERDHKADPHIPFNKRLGLDSKQLRFRAAQAGAIVEHPRATRGGVSVYEDKVKQVQFTAVDVIALLYFQYLETIPGIDKKQEMREARIQIPIILAELQQKANERKRQQLQAMAEKEANEQAIVT